MKKLIVLLLAVLVLCLMPFVGIATADDFGTVTGTGGYIYVSTGYQPRLIEVRTASPAQAVWVKGMAATSCMKTKTMDASGSLTTYVAIATPCLKVWVGNLATPPGFMIGIDSDLFPTGSVLYWHTVR